VVRRIDNLKNEQKAIGGLYAHARYQCLGIRNCSVLRDRFSEEVFLMSRRICSVDEEMVFRCESAFADDQRETELNVRSGMTFVEEVLSCARGLTI
jgi:hypothetical protein